MRETGVVRWFSRVKGFGFIVPDVGDDDLFVHYSDIIGEGYRNLYEGDSVSFVSVPTETGEGGKATQVEVRDAVSD